MVLLIVTGILHHFYAALLCAAIVILTGCISYRSILACFNPQFIMIIIASFPLSSFIINIGASEFLSHFLQPIFEFSPFWMFLCLYCIIWIATEFLNNLAIALITLPIFIASEPFFKYPYRSIDISTHGSIIFILLNANWVSYKYYGLYSWKI